MNIDEMQAGRQMDFVIGNKLFDLQLPKQRYSQITNSGGQTEQWDEWNGLPRYSTDIAAALPIAEKLNISLICSEDGWYAVKTEDVVHTCNREPNMAKEIHGKYWALADTIPLAICRAVLKAVGVVEV